MSDNLNKEIALLIERVNTKSGYKKVKVDVRDGGVYITHPSGILICYASIVKDKLDPEIYTVDYQAKILKEEQEALSFFAEVEKEISGQEKENVQKSIRYTLEDQQKASCKSNIKIKREKKKSYIEKILVSLAFIVLLSNIYIHGTNLYKRFKNNKTIQNYIGNDTNILNENTYRSEDLKHFIYENENIATSIKETGKNPWPLLTDLITDMGSNKEKNFPIVVNYLHSLGYFEYDFANLVIVANAKKVDGSCDFKKLISYMRERSVFSISQEQLKSLSKEEKEAISTFLVAFNSTLDTLFSNEIAEENRLGL